MAKPQTIEAAPPSLGQQIEQAVAERDRLITELEQAFKPKVAAIAAETLTLRQELDALPARAKDAAKRRDMPALAASRSRLKELPVELAALAVEQCELALNHYAGIVAAHDAFAASSQTIGQTISRRIQSLPAGSPQQMTASFEVSRQLRALSSMVSEHLAGRQISTGQRQYAEQMLTKARAEFDTALAAYLN